MIYPCNIRIEWPDKEKTLSFSIKSDKLKGLGGLPSGKPIAIIVPLGPKRILTRVVMKPYYRRFIEGELNIFAIVIPEVEEQ
jgi:hypothetical protein